jgi:hypothetical protein
MAIDRKWYTKNVPLKLPSGDLFKIIAVLFDVAITLSVVAGEFYDNDTFQTFSYVGLSCVYFMGSSGLLIFKTCVIGVQVASHTKDAEREWTYIVAVVDFALGWLVIIMGTMYLVGENLPSSLCMGDHCRQLKTGLLGMSLILNLFLTVAENGFGWSGGWDKIKTVDEKHKRWSDLLGLLNTVVLFDQALTGFHITVYDINMSSENITCDSYSNGLSGAMYGLSVVVFTLILICVQRYCRTWVKRNLKDVRAEIKKGSKLSWWKQYCKCGWKCGCYWIEESCFIGVGISLVIFFICFVLADLPWPWNCMDQINSQEWKTARFALLIISLVLVIIHFGLYICIVLIPSVCAFCRSRRSVVHNVNIRKLFGAQFKDMKTEDGDYCTYKGIRIKMQGGPKADQATLSLPLSFQVENDTNCSLWCQAYDFCWCTRQCRDGIAYNSKGDSNVTKPHKLNIGSVLFATAKKEATVLFIDEACNQEDLIRMLSQDTSDVIIHSFCESDQQPKRSGAN